LVWLLTNLPPQTVAGAGPTIANTAAALTAERPIDPGQPR
jgi:hypothetical protein